MACMFSSFEYTVKRLDKCYIRAQNNYFNPVFLQEWDCVFINKVSMLWNLPRNVLIEHDFTVDNLIQRLSMFQAEQYRCKAVLAE